MMLKVNNPNERLIEIIKNIYNEIFLEENMSFKKYIKKFNEIKKENYHLYSKLISCMFSYYWLLYRDSIEITNNEEKYGPFFDEEDEFVDNEEISDIEKKEKIDLDEKEDTFIELIDYEIPYEEAMEFQTEKDLIEYVENFPEFLATLITCTIDYSEMTYIDKKRLFTYSTDDNNDKYLKNICPLYIMDKIKYTQPITKENLIEQYDEKLGYYNDEDELFNHQLARNDIIIFLKELKASFFYNYDQILNDIINNFYIYALYLKDNDEIDPKDLCILNRLESQGTELFKEYITEIAFAGLDTIVDLFIEFSKLPEDKKTNIITYVNKYLKPKIRTKNKNNDDLK